MFNLVDEIIRRAARLPALATIAGALIAGRATAQYHYSVTDLGQGSSAHINNLGQVAFSGPQNVDYLYTPGIGLTSLGFGGPVAGINDKGQIIVNDGNGDAYIYSPGSGLLNLGGLGGAASAAYGINNAGDVVGESTSPENGGFYSAFVYSPEFGMGDLGPGLNLAFGSTHAPSVAVAINDLGEIVGLHDNAPFGYPPAAPFGALDGMTPAAINNLGQIVGDINEGGGNFTAALYTPGVGVTPVAAYGLSFAEAINDHGQAVGYSGGDAFIYSPDAGTVDLNSAIGISPGATTGLGINDLGQIVIQRGGELLLLTPVPEPSTLLLLTVGAALCFLLHRPLSMKNERREWRLPSTLNDVRGPSVFRLRYAAKG